MATRGCLRIAMPPAESEVQSAPGGGDDVVETKETQADEAAASIPQAQPA